MSKIKAFEGYEWVQRCIVISRKKSKAHAWWNRGKILGHLKKRQHMAPSFAGRVCSHIEL